MSLLRCRSSLWAARNAACRQHRRLFFSGAQQRWRVRRRTQPAHCARYHVLRRNTATASPPLQQSSLCDKAIELRRDCRPWLERHLSGLPADRIGALLSPPFSQTASCAPPEIGSAKPNVDPTPNALLTQTRPPCASTSCLTIASPRPAPPVVRARDLSAR